MIKKEVIGNATLYLGDCMDYMATTNDKEFKLAIVDPPYGININMSELMRVSAFQVIWGGNYFNLPNSGFIGAEGRVNPTQKPIKLYEWLLTKYVEKGQRILDTHLGSGSSAIACNNMGFEMVGIEIDEDYFNAACERIEQAQKQIRMFV